MEQKAFLVILNIYISPTVSSVINKTCLIILQFNDTSKITRALFLLDRSLKLQFRSNNSYLSIEKN